MQSNRLLLRAYNNRQSQNNGKLAIMHTFDGFHHLLLAKPEIYEALEERSAKYAIRIPANDSVERDIAELLARPVGRASYKPVVWYKGFLSQAAS